MPLELKKIEFRPGVFDEIVDEIKAIIAEQGYFTEEDRLRLAKKLHTIEEIRDDLETLHRVVKRELPDAVYLITGLPVDKEIPDLASADILTACRIMEKHSSKSPSFHFREALADALDLESGSSSNSLTDVRPLGTLRKGIDFHAHSSHPTMLYTVANPGGIEGTDQAVNTFLYTPDLIALLPDKTVEELKKPNFIAAGDTEGKPLIIERDGQLFLTSPVLGSREHYLYDGQITRTTEEAERAFTDLMTIKDTPRAIEAAIKITAPAGSMIVWSEKERDTGVIKTMHGLLPYRDNGRLVWRGFMHEKQDLAHPFWPDTKKEQPQQAPEPSQTKPGCMPGIITTAIKTLFGRGR